MLSSSYTVLIKGQIKLLPYMIVQTKFVFFITFISYLRLIARAGAGCFFPDPAPAKKGRHRLLINQKGKNTSLTPSCYVSEARMTAMSLWTTPADWKTTRMATRMTRRNESLTRLSVMVPCRWELPN